MNKKILVLCEKISFNQSKNPNIDYKNAYDMRCRPIFLKIFRHTRFIGRILGGWKKSDDYDVIIIFDTVATKELLRWIYHNRTKEKLILCYRNKVSSLKHTIQPTSIKKSKYEIWSYNLHDCEKYNLVYYKQILRRELFKINHIGVLQYDVLFLGTAKNRKDLLLWFANELRQLGLKTYFYVIGLPELPDNQCINEEAMPYEEYINLVFKTHAILDIVTEENYGLTWRPLETMFASKKLITNYKEIIRYDFYNEKNTFIINRQLISNLKNFIYSEYEDVPEDIVASYDVENWPSHFWE